MKSPNIELPLSIVIPTIGSQIFIDRAINSALLAAPSVTNEVLVSVNGRETSVTRRSQFRKHPKVRWQFSNEDVKPHWVSYDSAVNGVRTEWVLLLSDDDYLTPSLEQALKDFPWENSEALFATHILIQNSQSESVREGKKPPELLVGSEVLQAHFEDRFHHHLSLFIFPKKIHSEVGGYVPNLYPNGLFVDTVFHGWLCARAQLVLGASDAVLVRSESPNQSSGVFRIGREVNYLMQSVVNAFEQDELFSRGIVAKYGSSQKFYERLLVKRFGTELGKLRNPIYGRGFAHQLRLLFSFLFFWRVPRARKVRALASTIKTLKRISVLRQT